MPDKAIVETILRQLGGRRFIVMTGANNFLSDGPKLTFRVPGTMTHNHINYVTIGLDEMDTYTLKFYNIRGMKVKEIASDSSIYFDQLQSIFTERTGLDTHL